MSCAGVAAVSFDVDGTLFSDRFLRIEVALEAIRRGSPGPLLELGRLARRAESSRRAGALDPAWESDRPGRLEAEDRLLLPVIRRRGPRAGAAGLLARLRPRPVIAVSDFVAEAKLRALGLRDRFDHTYAAEAHGALKPDPRVFHAALADLRILPAALLHIGNRPDTDGEAARAAGCRVLILGADIASLGEVENLLEP